MPRKKTETEQEIPAHDYDFEVRKKCIIELGTTTFGNHWQTPLAEIPTKIVGRPYSVAQVNPWKSGERPVPRVVMDRLREVSLWLAHLNRLRADELEMMFRPRYSPRELVELYADKERYDQLKALLQENELLKEGE